MIAFREQTGPACRGLTSATFVPPTPGRAEDDRITELVNELAANSAEFRMLWDRHDVAVRRTDLKGVQHPTVGLIRLRCQVLVTPETGIRMRILLPLEDTDAADKLELLSGRSLRSPVRF
ncbi:hypothetical protein [Amycolatopsis rhizosphaerae]|uniref:MmyB family transcriptional regulator n=1 Tax=Amycolatopsis rhizosphaerae TaxID=2053003 RepID=UPI001FE2FA8A|nr:hypothetical protein [Amycolatopsis rhizosphaerae]